jgi:RNA polymerase I-specific transcription initiation factor RRN3
MGLLAGQIFAQGQPTILRITAASYLGSYIARAKFVDGQAVKTCMKLLVHYAVQYLDRHESSVNQKTMSKHGTFYAIVQAILYVFCFRWRDIVSSDHPKGQLPLEMAGFKRILTSQLIPFKVCSVHIVDEFARLTHELDILYCYPFMSRDSTSKWRDEERNSKVSEKDVNSSKSNGADLAATILDRLDTFFPFDPLTLPKSKKFMEGLYQEWESNDSDSESEQGGDEGEVDEHQVDEMAFSLEGTLSIE